MSSIPVVAPPERSPLAAPKPPLQLSASRGRLALELSEPLVLGPLRIVELVATIDGLRFPVDLSGGVSRFRHRRGSLDHIAVEVSLPQLAKTFTPIVRQTLGKPTLRLDVLPSHQGIVVGAHDHDFALAFHVLFAPDDLRVRWVVCNARAVGLGPPAHAAALRVAQAIAGKPATREGSTFTLLRALPRLVSEALVDAGARVPSMHDVRFTAWEETQDGFRVEARRDHPSLFSPPHVIRALELSRIAADADDALAVGDLPRARDAYLRALESAPRHPDIALRLAELDMLAGNSNEAALASIVETMPAVDGGLVASHLLAATGDREAAQVAARRAAESEVYSPLAALMHVAAASLARDARERLALLDEAVARAPAGHAIRWTRARARVELGRTEDAVADLGHLEASAASSRLKFDACMQAGHLLLAARTPVHARRFFERALRYIPGSASASTGLARAFIALNDFHRGVGLLARAVSLTERTDEPDADLLLELAQALAEHANDLPSAVFHARTVPFGSTQTVTARALEGRWRAMLGDPVGASLAFAHAREAIEALPPDAARSVAHWLIEGARYELSSRGCAADAKRLAELALRSLPRDADALEVFRNASAALAAVTSPVPAPIRSAPLDVHHAEAPTPVSMLQPDRAQIIVPIDDRDRPVQPIELQAPTGRTEAEAEARVVQLTDRVRANPEDTQATMELCDLLEGMGRHLDLMALVSARLDEESNPDRLRSLRCYYRAALVGLVASCLRDGRNEEAQIYEDVLATLDDDTPA